MKELLNKPLPAIPAIIKDELDKSEISLTYFNECGLILQSDALQQEAGYRQFPDGSWLVSIQ